MLERDDLDVESGGIRQVFGPQSERDLCARPKTHLVGDGRDDRAAASGNERGQPGSLLLFCLWGESIYEGLARFVQTLIRNTIGLGPAWANALGVANDKYWEIIVENLRL